MKPGVVSRPLLFLCLCVPFLSRCMGFRKWRFSLLSSSSSQFLLFLKIFFSCVQRPINACFFLLFAGIKFFPYLPYPASLHWFLSLRRPLLQSQGLSRSLSLSHYCQINYHYNHISYLPISCSFESYSWERPACQVVLATMDCDAKLALQMEIPDPGVSGSSLWTQYQKLVPFTYFWLLVYLVLD